MRKRLKIQRLCAKCVRTQSAKSAQAYEDKGLGARTHRGRSRESYAEAVFHGHLLSGVRGRFVTGENVYSDRLSCGPGEVKVAIPTLDSKGRAPGGEDPC